MFDPADLDLATAAYHEAGHVLMAHLLGGYVVHVTLESDEEEFAGLTTVRWPNHDERDRQRCSALAALAGPLAESRWRGEAITLEVFSAWHADWKEVQAALAAHSTSGDATKLLHQWMHEVRQQLDDPLVWEVLCRIADALEAHGSLHDDLLDDVLGRP